MRRSIILSTLLVVVAIVCNAQPITKQQAEQKAMVFMKQKGMPIERGVTNVSLSEITMGDSPIYVFNATGGKGFVIISGDERTEEILGYSTECHFDEKKLSEATREWLKGYATQIDDLQMGRVKTKPLKVNKHEAIGKMVSSSWDQGVETISGDAYNQLCPTYEGNHCQAGCVATAMAQVMRYHEWPTDYCSEIPGYTVNEVVGYVSALPKLKFDWSHMLDRYDEGQNEQECNAVAQLMQYCGSAVEMNYATGTSIAYIPNAAFALKTYFNYDANTRFVFQRDCAIDAWDNLIYNELKNGRPVIYSGNKIDYGHSFVCDGYDGDGFYHINWGWGGYCNGYYKLAILNPFIGGYSDSGYTMNQSAIVGIQKPTDATAEERALSADNFFIDGHTIGARYSNHSGFTDTFDFGFAYKKAIDDDTSYQLKKNTDLFEPRNWQFYVLDLDTMNLSDGTYNFYPFAVPSGSTSLHILCDYTKYFEVTVSGGKVSTIINHPTENWYVKSIECVSNRVVNQPQEIQVTIKNEGEDFNCDLYLHVSNSDDLYGGYVDEVYLPITSGGEETTSLFFTPTTTGKWKVWVDNTWDGMTAVSTCEFDVIDAPTTASDLSVESYEIIANTDAIFKAKIKNNSSTAGYFMPIHGYLFEPPFKNYNIDFQRTRNMNIAPGETADVEFRFESLEPGKDYIVLLQMFTYHNSDERQWIGYYNFTVANDDPNGISTPAIDACAPVDVYSLSGVLLRKKATTLRDLPSGIYIVNGRKVVVGAK